MATTSPKPSPPTSRRTGPSPTPISTTLARGASARSAASSRVSTLNNAANRRSVTVKGASPTPAVNGEAHEVLAASLKQETDQKEQLLVQLQDKDQLISNYITDTNNLTSSLSAAESRLNELYTEQSRWEMEMAQRMDISEKLREQVRELEKEKRDIQRRYNEQTATFEAERQAFYDNEQHLKSRIQTLSQVSRKRTESNPAPAEPEPEDDAAEEDLPSSPNAIDDGPESVHQDFNDPESEPAEMTSLKLELSTLSTSYASLQSTLILMQTQLVDLKRVNQELQEDNESYMILLRERTLSGQFDVLKQVGGTGSATDEDNGSDEDRGSTDVDSMRSRGRSTLDIVEEEPFENMDSEALGDLFDSDTPQRHSRHPSRPERKRTSSSHRGESLAGLPITGPGLDLAAELGRAENKDILAGDSIEDGDRQAPAMKNKRSKKDGLKLPSSESGNIHDIEALRTEVKSLKDANKALSLYASKIIDRIIAQEGFEHVLAVDYEKEPATPSTAIPHANAANSLPFSNNAGAKQRPQSVSFGKPTKSFEAKLPSPPAVNRPNAKAQRRSLSFDWKTFSLFNTDKKPEPSPNLRPLTLKPGSTPVTGNARKLDNMEDEDDRKERERLHATMKLMGIQPTSPLPSPSPMDRAASSPGPGANAKNNRRFSLFGGRTPVTESSDASSVHSTSSLSRAGMGLGLTEEALEHAEAEQSLAVLDARERELSVEIAKGSAGGFTEIARRTSKRGRRSAGGSSGSTVWSAGMSGNDGED